MSDQELRIHAAQLAVKHAGEVGFDETDIISLAKEIYEFIKGETKNV
jgi:hypothetical protein